MKDNVVNILNYLSFGIEVNGNIREFDIVDYYQNFNVEKDILIKYAKDMLTNNLIEVKDYAKIRSFFGKNELKERMTPNNIKEIYEGVNEFNTKIDKNGMSIKNSGRLVTLEEKKYIFDYIINNNLPMHRKVYTILLNRLVNGELTIDKQRKV